MFLMDLKLLKRTVFMIIILNDMLNVIQPVSNEPNLKRNVAFVINHAGAEVKVMHHLLWFS